MTINHLMMKILTLLTILILILHFSCKSQDFKVDNRLQSLKEDSKNELQADEITNIDFMQALELAGVKIHKFNIGTFNRKYKLYFLLNEYVDGEALKTDTLFVGENTYAYYENDTRYFNYIDQIKIFTKKENELLKIMITSLTRTWQSKIDYEISEKGQNFFIRYYSVATWKENVAIPLMVFASSWKDKKYGFYRFCGTTKLDDENDETKALLKFSPHYFKISYIASRNDE